MNKDLRLLKTNHNSKEYGDRYYFDFLISGQLLKDYLGLKNITLEEFY